MKMLSAKAKNRHDGFSNLTEETIRKKTSAGDTPLHRAAGLGRICEIPKHLLRLELFLVKNNSNRTPIHRAAMNGFLDKVPKEFLTKETLTVSAEYEKKESRTGPTPPRTETPLHTAAFHGHANQIPKAFLKPEFLSIEAKGYRQTVLHYFAMSKCLDLIPEIYAHHGMWDLRDSSGKTPRGILEGLIEREAYVAHVRSESVTEKQKEKLRWFGCPFDEGMTKGQASDALDKCVRDFPERERAYYSRPATEEQMAILHAHYGKNLDEVNGPFTYGKVKDLISEFEMNKRCQDRVADLEKTHYEFILLRFLRWRVERYRHLTYSRVKKAARALDRINTGWTKSGDCEDLLLQKVTELFPELAAKENWL